MKTGCLRKCCEDRVSGKMLSVYRVSQEMLSEDRVSQEML